MYRLASYGPALPGYYTCCTSRIGNNVDVNKDLFIKINLFINNKAFKFKCLLKNLKFLP